MRRWLAVPAGFTVFFVAFFWPVLSRGLIVGDPVDQLIEALPAYLHGHPLWEPATMLGYPYAANPLAAAWYPLAWLRYIPGSFDAYEIAAYVIAATGAFGLARALTGSTTGAAIAGLTYSLGGFMISHAGHVSVIEPAAWAPFVFWSFTLLRERVSTPRVAFAAIAIAAMTLAGQPQPLVYTLYAAVAYVIVLAFGARAERRSFIAASAGALFLGAGLAAIELVPGIQLAFASVRAGISYPEHVGFSVPLSQVPLRLLFPYLFGYTHLWPYTQSAINVGSFAEMSNYAGVVTLSLAVIGVASSRRMWFWTALFVIAALLSASYDTGLGHLTLRLPGLAWFRAPGRHALEMTLAAAVLAAAGVAAIERNAVSARRLAVCLGGLGAVMFGVLFVFALWGTPIASAVREFPPSVLDPVRNPALWIPALLFLIGATAITAFSRWTGRPTRTVLVGVVALDLLSFASFAYWNEGAFPISRVAPTQEAIALRDAIAPLDQRILSFPGAEAAAGIPPNLNVLWNVPNARGYTTLGLERTAQFLPLDTVAQERTLLQPGDHRLDAAGVRYLVFPADGTAERPASSPFDAGADLGLEAGGSAPAMITVDLPRPVRATHVVLVSSLFQGDSVREGTPVAEILCTDPAGETARATLNGGSGPSRFDDLPLGRSMLVRRIQIRRIGSPQSGGALSIRWLSFVDDAARVAHPLTAIDYVLDDPRWRQVSNLGPDQIFENKHALPRAWTVHDVRVMTSGGVLRAVESSGFDPARTAIVEEGRLDVEPTHGSDEVRVEQLMPVRMVLHVSCASACLLVTGDAWYPGWRAAIDGRATDVFPVDYALRGAAVPAGTHEVEFRYRPLTTYAGAAVTIVAVSVLALCVLRRAR